MLKRHLCVLIGSLLLGASAHAATPATAPAPVAPITLTPTDAQAVAGRVVMTFMSRYHLNPRELDPALSAQVFDQLIDTLDPQRSMFTQQDLTSFAATRNGVGSLLADGEIAPLIAPVDLYLNRLVDQSNFELGLLDGTFDFTGHDSIVVDRSKAPRPASMDDLHALWKLRVEDDWLRLKLADRPDDAIRKTLRKRYEGVVTRARKATAEDAFQWVMSAYATTMDPHTDYFAPKAARDFATEMSLSVEGIGAYLREHDEYIQVTELMPGGPASLSKAIHVGDRITAVGQGTSGPMVDVTGQRTDDVITLIRGKAGSTVRLEILPDETKGDAAAHTVSVVRKHISIEDQAAQSSVIEVGAPNATHRIGVLTVPSFYEDFDAKKQGGNYRSVSKDVAGLLDNLRKQKVDGVVLDLRDNGGGSLTEAVALGGLFCGAGPVVQVKDARGNVDVQTASTPVAWTGPLVVMVNRGSASASEILAADLQDRGRAVVVGNRTFGKGTVQSLIDLDSVVHQDGLGELKMTIAQFYRIDGSTTQLAGVKPDITFPATYAEKDFGESTYKNALPSSTVTAASFVKDPAVGSMEATLQKEHDARIAGDASWKLAVERLQAYRTIADRTTVSLNFAERKATREADARTLKDLHARELALAPGDADDDAVSADDGLDPSERPLDKANARPGKKAKTSDPFLHEAAAMAEDEAVLMTSLAHRDTGAHPNS